MTATSLDARASGTTISNANAQTNESRKVASDGWIYVQSRSETQAKIQDPLLSTNARPQNAEKQIVADQSSVPLDKVNSTIRYRGNRLPTPAGMIEIVDDHGATASTGRELKVSTASLNPFEVLQLFVGSSNMTDHGSSEARTLSLSALSGSELLDDGGEVSRDDIVLVMATGILVSVAVKYGRLGGIDRWRFGTLSKVPVRSDRRRPRPR